jgi:hypothetical protein
LKYRNVSRRSKCLPFYPPYVAAGQKSTHQYLCGLDHYLKMAIITALAGDSPTALPANRLEGSKPGCFGRFEPTYPPDYPSDKGM